MTPFFVTHCLKAVWLIFLPFFDESHHDSYNGKHQQYMDKKPDDFKYQANNPAQKQYSGNGKK
jgi:hypothetical protein